MSTNKDSKTVIIIAGPTAVGKTHVAIHAAKYYNTEIISADSRQCYKELRIGVARPSIHELQQVPHHFIATHSIHDEVTAASFEIYALQKVKELFERYDTVIMTGGTGLYIKAFCEGLDPVPAINAVVRQRIISEYQARGLEWLQEQVRQKDPAFYASGEIQNPQRLMRALEVVESTNTSILDFRKGTKAQRDFNIVYTGLELPKEQLHRNIHTRVDKMMEEGLLDEVKSLSAFRHLNALQTVGYAELFEYLDGRITLETAVEQIKTNTRQYAKRQLTWFRRIKGTTWYSPEEACKRFSPA
ncbi:MAG TPA: tRNA (adenosine(37)-N6)-dimethylallyltransferase MiaA [Chitinophagaceae bacterium]